VFDIDKDIPGWMSIKELFILSSLANMCPVNGSILEIGCFLGRSTTALYKGKHTSVQLDVVDHFQKGEHAYYNKNKYKKYPLRPIPGDLKIYNEAIKIIKTHGWEEAFKFCVGEEIYNSLNVYPITSKEFKKNKSYDLVFIDGSHLYEDIFHDIKKYSGNNTLLIGDDFNFYYPDVSKAINVLRNNRTLWVFENTKLWALIPKLGHWKDKFNSKMFLL